MHEISFTLLSDGSADRVLVPILTWLLREHLPGIAIQWRWADFRRLLSPPRDLCDRIQVAIELFPCDLLFVHRDAENVALPQRLAEIDQVISQAGSRTPGLPACIGVVPVRMTEAWLLVDVAAIREAAGNPSGTAQLDLPRLTSVENLSDPKERLHALIIQATELGSRRRRRFNVNNAVQHIPKYIGDFSPLRRLSAFSSLEDRVVETVISEGWGD